jgi:hypothetical protein
VLEREKKTKAVPGTINDNKLHYVRLLEKPQDKTPEQTVC